MGTPLEMVTKKMQEDARLARGERRNYKSILHGLSVLVRTQGVLQLYSGWRWVAAQKSLVAVGGMACYDQIRQVLMAAYNLEDNVSTHFLCGFLAGCTATLVSQPLEATRNFLDLRRQSKMSSISVLKVLRLSLSGIVPLFLRLGPQTVFTLIFIEQMRLNFGLVVFDSS